MARPRKLDVVADENVEIMENQGESAPVISETPVEPVSTEKIPKICENPYLTEAQKSVLINYELRKLLDKVKLETDTSGKWTLLRYSVPVSPVKYIYYLINAVGANVKDAWEFYRENVKDATIRGFVGIMSETMGTKLEYRELDLIDMD